MMDARLLDMDAIEIVSIQGGRAVFGFPQITQMGAQMAQMGSGSGLKAAFEKRAALNIDQKTVPYLRGGAREPLPHFLGCGTVRR